MEYGSSGGGYDDEDAYEEMEDDDTDIDDFDYEDEHFGKRASNSSHRIHGAGTISTGGTDGDDDNCNGEESGVSPKMVRKKYV